MENTRRSVTALLLFAALLQACDHNTTSNKEKFNEISRSPVMIDISVRDYRSAEPLRALPDTDQLLYSNKVASLGQRLFHDTRLSGDGTVSCASCHNLDSGGDDGLSISTGIDGKKVASMHLQYSIQSLIFLSSGMAGQLILSIKQPFPSPTQMRWATVGAML